MTLIRPVFISAGVNFGEDIGVLCWRSLGGGDGVVSETDVNGSVAARCAREFPDAPTGLSLNAVGNGHFNGQMRVDRASARGCFCRRLWRPISRRSLAQTAIRVPRQMPDRAGVTAIAQ